MARLFPLAYMLLEPARVILRKTVGTDRFRIDGSVIWLAFGSRLAVEVLRLSVESEIKVRLFAFTVVTFDNSSWSVLVKLYADPK